MYRITWIDRREENPKLLRVHSLRTVNDVIATLHANDNCHSVTFQREAPTRFREIVIAVAEN